MPEVSAGEQDRVSSLVALLNHILECVILREYQRSCNFSSGTGPMGQGREGHTVQAFNTPFRGDHPESFIIT